MSETLQRSGQGFLQRYAGLQARLPGHGGMRAAAARSFAALGFPGPRDEAWKYTSLRGFAGLDFVEPLLVVGDRPVLLDRLDLLDAPLLVYMDGRFRHDLSNGLDALPAAGAGEFRLARPDRDAFAALNAMLAEDGARIFVAPGVDAGIVQIASLATIDVHGRPVAFHPRHHIELGAGARLTLIEVALGEGYYLHNPLSEITVAAGAELTHLRLLDEAPTAYHLSTSYIEVGAAARYDGFALNIGGAVTRNEVHARIGGDGGTVHLNGAQLLRGKQHGDVTTTIAHDAVGGRSRQTVRNVLSEAARGVFQGRIDVARIAQQTDGYQMNHALLLSPTAEIDSKPELRINADDVKCSHGATVGQLDAEQLFYLRSRGISSRDAYSMLIRGFLSESLADIVDETQRGLFERAVDRWWERQPR